LPPPRPCPPPDPPPPPPPPDSYCCLTRLCVRSRAAVLGALACVSTTVRKCDEELCRGLFRAAYSQEPPRTTKS